jgi:2-amino-4-hydroxy-6-hydroxymethyldihydropteridine diphosphokinase
MPSVYLSIGSNVEREENIRSALKALHSRFGKIALSSVYETEAVGFNGPPFFNLTIHFESDKPVRDIAKALRQIETSHGRTRRTGKFTGRTLDLDILLYGDLILNEGKFQIPRKDIMLYAFVLEPLAEIAPDGVYPITGERFAMMWQNFDKEGINQQIVDFPV